jgi:hypothetical protein
MKAYKLFIVVLIGFVMILSGCKPKPAPSGPTTFTLQMNLKYGNQNMDMNTDYMDSTGRYVTFNYFQFLLSHINLIKADGSTVNVANVAIFDFDPGASLVSVTANNVEGNFTGISFACGLDSATNNIDSAGAWLYPNPLSGQFNMAWIMLQYQFELVEGKWDTAELPLMRNGLFYHIGTAPAYRPNIQLNKSFTVSGSPYTLNMYLDVAQIFKNTTTGERLNMATEGESQSATTDNPVVLTTFADNFSHSFTFTGP